MNECPNAHSMFLKHENDLMPVCVHCPHIQPVLPVNSLCIDVEVCPEAAGSLLSV